VCNNGGRRRLAAASGPSVTIIYSVSYDTVKSVEEDRSILTGSVTSGAFTSALRVNAASAGATALLSAISTAVKGCVEYMVSFKISCYRCFRFHSGGYYFDGKSFSSSVLRSFCRSVRNYNL
jgi:hypothetical protein